MSPKTIIAASNSIRPVMVIPNGVDPEIFYPVDAEQRKQLRAQFALRDDQPIVMFSGRFVDKKGLPVIEKLSQLMPEWRFWLAGHGPINPERWYRTNVHVFRERSGPSLAELYRTADLFILPSYGEGFPLVVQKRWPAACRLFVVRQRRPAVFWPSPSFDGDRRSGIARANGVHLGEAPEGAARISAVAGKQSGSGGGGALFLVVAENCRLLRRSFRQSPQTAGPMKAGKILRSVLAGAIGLGLIGALLHFSGVTVQSLADIVARLNWPAFIGMLVCTFAFVFLGGVKWHLISATPPPRPFFYTNYTAQAMMLSQFLPAPIAIAVSRAAVMKFKQKVTLKKGC